MEKLTEAVVASVTGHHHARLMRMPNVVGFCRTPLPKIVGGAETATLCIRVMVSTKVPKGVLRQGLLARLLGRDELVPPTLDGVPTDVVQVGEVKLLGILGQVVAAPPATGRFDPLVAGVSVGHVRVTAGTLGAFVYDRSGAAYVLSNNHVLAAASFRNDPKAQVDDPILQPGAYDGGKDPADVAARLSNWVPYDSGANRYDVAWARATRAVSAGEVLGRGKVTLGPPLADVPAGRHVWKVGRTTSYTEGQVIDPRAVIQVDVGGGRVAQFDPVMMVFGTAGGPRPGDAFLQPGDSGSLVSTLKHPAWPGENQPVGLAFAGSPGAAFVCYVLPLLQEKELSFQPPTSFSKYLPCELLVEVVGIATEPQATRLSVAQDPPEKEVPVGTVKRFNGQLTMEGGAAIPDARVEMRDEAGVQSATTDGDGRFSFSYQVMRAGKHELRLVYAGQ